MPQQVAADPVGVTVSDLRGSPALLSDFIAGQMQPALIADALWAAWELCNEVAGKASSDLDLCCRAKDFFRILTEPEHNMIKQQQALIATEGVELIFTEPAIRRISEVAEEVNTLVDNIGARRLHTILERILEEISFNAPEEVMPDLSMRFLVSAGCFADFHHSAFQYDRTGDWKLQPDAASAFLCDA